MEFKIAVVLFNDGLGHYQHYNMANSYYYYNNMTSMHLGILPIYILLTQFQSAH